MISTSFLRRSSNSLNNSDVAPERLPSPWLNCFKKDLSKLMTNNQLSGDQKDWVADEYIYHNQSYAELSERYNVSVELLRLWVCRRRNRINGICGHKRKLQGNAGRPKLLTPEQMKDYANMVDLETKGSFKFDERKMFSKAAQAKYL